MVWGPSSRSPLTVLLSYLCLFANILLDGPSQVTPRIYFGCFSTAALVVGTSLERRFVSEDVQELDLLDFAPGIIAVLGAAAESAVQQFDLVDDYVRGGVLMAASIAASILSLEYYFDGDYDAIIRTFYGRRKKGVYGKVTATLPSTKLKTKKYHHVAGTFVAKYEVGKKLGSGYFGIVVVALDKTQSSVDENRSRCYAAKCVARHKLTYDEESQVRNEVTVLSELGNRHPAIISLFDFIDEPSNFYIVLEYMRGGELFDRINQKEKYFEKDARVIVKTLASALSFLHAQDIVHRDLKPENILLDSPGPNARIKLADFGFARRVDNGCTTTCGTPNYVAPEIIDGSVYGTSVDIWALGVITYILLSGLPPFHEVSRPKLFRKIRTGSFSFPDPYFSLVSYQAQDFVKKCLTRNPEQRLTADEVLQHPWIIGPAHQRKLTHQDQSERLDNDSTVGDAPELVQAKGRLRLFNARTRLKAGILAAIATDRMTQIAAALKEEAARME